MALDAEGLIERRRLRRRLRSWRVAAVVLAVAACVAAAFAWDPDGTWLERPHVARITVSGVIAENRRLDAALADVRDDPKARALILRIDSPGGSTYGGEALYRQLRRVSEKKPVVAVIGTLGASAGYLAAVAADRIYAGDTSLTGSIGVIIQSAEVSGLLDKIGVTAETVKAGALKDQPSLTRPLDAAGRQALQGLVDETHRWFIDRVAERRALPRDRVVELADGRVYNGTRAAEFKLVDEIGAEPEARAWLASAKNVARSLPVYDYDYNGKRGVLAESALALIGKSLIPERLTLDGLVSVWQPRSD
ncbi:MAG: signal peptide peptidase SppA [Ferrovibrionaceae bacterium]